MTPRRFVAYGSVEHAIGQPRDAAVSRARAVAAVGYPAAGPPGPIAVVIGDRVLDPGAAPQDQRSRIRRLTASRARARTGSGSGASAASRHSPIVLRSPATTGAHRAHREQ